MCIYTCKIVIIQECIKHQLERVELVTVTLPYATTVLEDSNDIYTHSIGFLIGVLNSIKLYIVYKTKGKTIKLHVIVRFTLLWLTATLTNFHDN